MMYCHRVACEWVFTSFLSFFIIWIGGCCVIHDIFMYHFSLAFL